jgi:type 1 glutamine amidotransferase
LGTIFIELNLQYEKTLSALTLVLFVILLSCNKREGSPRVLVFEKPRAFTIVPFPLVWRQFIEKLGLQNNFRVDTTTDASYFNDDSLKNYAAVVFVSTTGKVFDASQEASMERYIQAGGGFVGIHAASDIGNEWGWFTRMIGGLFLSHPAQQEATLLVVDKTHPSTQHLPDKWVRKDEWYNFQKINHDLKVLIKIDEKSYEGGKNGDNHPMAWYHNYDGGRAWYTELGHTDESYSDSLYLGHLLGGIQYAMDGNKTLDYSKAKTQLPPAEDQFCKNGVDAGTLTEPTELTVLPSLCPGFATS